MVNTEIDVVRVTELFMDKNKCCAEAVLQALLEHYSIPFTEEDILLAAGFGGGVGGCGCVCGTLAGSVIAVGKLFKAEKLILDLYEGPEDKKNEWKDAYVSKYISGQIHSHFKEFHTVACCKVITKKVAYDKKIRKEFCKTLNQEVVEHAINVIDEYIIKAREYNHKIN